MRYAPRKTPSVWPILLTVGALGVLAVFGVVGTTAALWAMGKIDLPFLSREPSHEGMVGLPLSGQPIPRYTKITRDHLFSPKVKTWAVKYVRPDQVPPGVIVETNQLFGRVLKHDKPEGYVFTEDDFYPKGTVPGTVAGIPPGMRAVTLDPDKINGIRALQAGDHIDILGALPLDDRKHQATLGLLTTNPAMTNTTKHAAVRVLAQNAVIVSPVTTRMVPISGATLTSSGQVRNKPIQEVEIAVDPREAGPLLEALSLSAELLCIARSGRPEDPGAASVTPDLAPTTPTISTVKVWVGTKQETEVFVHQPPAPLPTTPTTGMSRP